MSHEVDGVISAAVGEQLIAILRRTLGQANHHS